MKNDTEFEAYKPIFKIETVCSNLIGQPTIEKPSKKSIFLQLN